MSEDTEYYIMLLVQYFLLISLAVASVVVLLYMADAETLGLKVIDIDPIVQDEIVETQILIIQKINTSGNGTMQSKTVILNGNGTYFLAVYGGNLTESRLWTQARYETVGLA